MVRLLHAWRLAPHQCRQRSKELQEVALQGCCAGALPQAATQLLLGQQQHVAGCAAQHGGHLLVCQQECQQGPACLSILTLLAHRCQQQRQRVEQLPGGSGPAGGIQATRLQHARQGLKAGQAVEHHRRRHRGVLHRCRVVCQQLQQRQQLCPGPSLGLALSSQRVEPAASCCHQDMPARAAAITAGALRACRGRGPLREAQQGLQGQPLELLLCGRQALPAQQADYFRSQHGGRVLGGQACRPWQRRRAGTQHFSGQWGCMS